MRICRKVILLSAALLTLMPFASMRAGLTANAVGETDAALPVVMDGEAPEDEAREVVCALSLGEEADPAMTGDGSVPGSEGPAATNSSKPASGTILLGAGEEYVLDVASSTGARRIKYGSSRPAVAGVSKKGVVKAKEPGRTTITCWKGDRELASYRVKVVPAPKKVSFSVKRIRIGEGDSIRLAPRITKGSHASFSWSSLDEGVAVVSDAGEITGKAPGRTTIEVRTHNKRKASIDVFVVKPSGEGSQPSIRVLSVGNSFSVDAHYYLWNVLHSMGYRQIELGNLYVASCSLKKHLKNAKKDRACYTFYRYSSDNKGKRTTRKHCTLEEGLYSQDWDYITFQQFSGTSGIAESYDDLPALIDYVRKRCPSAKLVWHMTWAYQGDSRHKKFALYDNSQDKMYRSIVSAVRGKIVPNADICRIIPTGTAIQNARTSLLGDHLTRDGFHLGYKGKGVPGRYIAALCFARILTGQELDIDRLYSPSNLTGKMKEISVEAVNNAAAHPFRVTPSEYR